MSDRESSDGDRGSHGSSDGSEGSDGGDDSDDGGRVPRKTAFLCDVMLGSLVTYCRMCGSDTAYTLDRGIEADSRLLDLAREEGRRLLTRDRQLAARAQSADSSDDGDDERRPRLDTDGLLLESRDVTGQLRELRAAGYELTVTERPTRCGRCNAPLEAVGKEENTPAYAPSTDVESVWRCIECGQCFWQGSHWESVERTLAEL